MAGVSSATVSRVINGGHWVSDEARLAVESAIADTGYTANRSARSLATGRADSFAFLLTEEHHLLFTDPTFSRLLRGAAQAVSRHGKTLVLLVAGTSEERANVEHYVRSGHVDGVMMISSHEAEPLVGSLLQAGIPTVACGLPLGYQDAVSSVSVDEAGSAATMVSYLRSRGHRRIAHISGPDDTPGGRYRAEGFREAMGADLDEQLIVSGDYSDTSGYTAMQELLERSRDIDAVFAASDSMAYGAMSLAKETGLRIPHDIAVAGFDDSGLAESASPGLTTMRQPWDELSAEMVQLLLEQTQGRPIRRLTLPTQLIIRDSA